MTVQESTFGVNRCFASAHFLYQISIFQSSFWFFITLLYKIVFCYSFVKGPLSLASAICPQRTAVLVYLFYIQRMLSLLHVLLTKDCGTCLLLFICKGLLSLSFCYSIAKDRSPYPVLFTCKELRSLSSAIHLQRAAVLV